MSISDKIVTASTRETRPAGLAFNIMHYSLHDGPGIRTTVFFKGCPLSCWWCHNPESQSARAQLMYFPDRCIRCGTCVVACPEHAITEQDGVMVTSGACRACGTCAEVCPADARELVGRRMSVDQLMSEIEKDVIFFDESGGGVTFSGGEPLMHPDFLEALLAACNQRRIHTAVDTCGLAPRDVLLRIAPRVNLFLFDLKLVDSARHERYAGVPNETILQNLEALARSGAEIIIRVPVIPGINDGEDDTAQMIGLLCRLGLRRVELLPYHKIGIDKYRRLGMEYRLEGLEPPGKSRMHELALRFERQGFLVQAREGLKTGLKTTETGDSK